MEETNNQKSHWLIVPGNETEDWKILKKENFISLPDYFNKYGDLKKYKSKDELEWEIYKLEENQNVPPRIVLWDFANTMKIGDLVLAKTFHGDQKLLGLGVVESDYIYSPQRDNFHHIRKVKWTMFGEATMLTTISLFDCYELLKTDTFGDNYFDDLVSLLKESAEGNSKDK